MKLFHRVFTTLVILIFKNEVKTYTLFLYKQHFYKQPLAEIGKKSSKC